MFKPFLKRMWPHTGARTDREDVRRDTPVEYGRLVARIIGGDAGAEAELVELFEDAVLHIIRRIAKNSSLVEDFSQDVFLTVIKKIRNGDLQQPESLGAFIANTARFHTIEQLRTLKQRAAIEDLEQAELLPDLAPNRLDELQTAEQLNEIRSLVSELRPRYRELLLRFYLNEEPKATICADLRLTSSQFDGVLHRARNRFKGLYLERKATKKWHRS